MEAYRVALGDLAARRLTYACTCTRRDIAEAVSAPQEGAARRGRAAGSGRPGLSRHLPRPLPTDGRAARHPPRLAAAIEALGGPAAVDALAFTEIGHGPGGETGTIRLSADRLIAGCGDIVLGRRDGAPAYHLSVVVDDAYQGVTHVSRGRDLFPATPIHRLLQALLGLPTPVYRHHRLVRDAAGKRLAKRDDARVDRRLSRGRACARPRCCAWPASATLPADVRSGSPRRRPSSAP